ncbi:ABC transporter substrate-binding protein [Paenibacillus radicis (ex Xue et al. 2023)]|uniref:ABC transporter substrate-binding protein n=1 Tax=Paenibacillus radicis (ex Xue et al. 2023) TaxID=2972489 RepID=A0ABT1Y9G7_9BACL|nr:ABC transporter substrate-binding protein [Paenibacillus radicis (ex Xue et al. 2023)]MCR8629823.1 ABC transporter substrate-binding protein [Paenibacillus radicis (ex Xue et al. 2023)]
MKKTLAVLVAASLAVVSGCGGGGTAGSGSGAGSQETAGAAQKGEAKAPSAGPVTLKLWTTEKDALKSYLDAFHAANANIKVEAEFMGDYDEMAKKVQAGIVSNSLPHLVQLGQRHAIPQIADSGKLLPIESFMTKEEIADILPGFWQRYTYKDKKWVIPFQSSTPVMYYNKTMLDKQGLKVPDTWDELIETGKKVSGNGVWGLNLNSDSPWYFQPMVWNRGGQMIKPDGTPNVNGKEAVETLKSIQDAVHVSHIMPQNQIKTSGEDFAAGKLAMLMRSGASLAALKKQIGDKFEIGVAFLPKVKERWVPIGGNGLGIFKSDKAHEEAAWKLVSFLTSAEITAKNSMETGYIPVKKAAFELPDFKQHLTKDPNFKVAIDQTQYLRGEGIHPADALIWSGVIKAIETVHNDPKADPQKVMDKLQTEIVEYMKTYK